MKKILITGAKGFIGSNVSRHFKSLGYQTFGIGYGSLSVSESRNIGLDYWKDGSISIESVLEFDQKFDVIVHCGGSGSVGFSVENPYLDFKKTVDGTLEVLEFMRVHNPNAHLIYPSSPAVQGECDDKPICEEFAGKPVSPYGYHKKIAENLCQSYSEKFNLKVSVVRLFSVYGVGLKKQLLWDAVQKFKHNKDKEVVFWGTGGETRDFIHIDDAILLFAFLVELKHKFLIINGGSGSKSNIKRIVESIRDIVNPSLVVGFNNLVNVGNPIYYWADINKLTSLGFRIEKKFEYELQKFVDWAVKQDD